MDPKLTKSHGLPSFVAESTLGRLTKWLRLAGFNVSSDRGKPNAGRLKAMARDARIILTRTHNVFNALGLERAIFINHDQVGRQSRQIMLALGVKFEDLQPMKNCAACNRGLVHADKADAHGKVPAYIWHHHATFLKCPQCHRFYWPGTHADAIRVVMRSWFP